MRAFTRSVALWESLHCCDFSNIRCIKPLIFPSSPMKIFVLAAVAKGPCEWLLCVFSPLSMEEVG